MRRAGTMIAMEMGIVRGLSVALVLVVRYRQNQYTAGSPSGSSTPDFQGRGWSGYPPKLSVNADIASRLPCAMNRLLQCGK
jgi:hypothetical protein